MGCLSSKPSTNHQQHQINPNHNLVFPTNHTIHEDDALKLTPPPKQEDDTHKVQTNTGPKRDDTLDRCSSFHTVKEYDELLQRITDQNDAELAGQAPVPGTTDHSASNNDANTEMTMNEKKQDTEFHTVPSLRQWLHAPGDRGGGGAGGGIAITAADFTTTKAGFSFYDSNSNNNSNNEKSDLVKSGKEEGEENIVELVAAFDKYMEQLQIDEDNILKQIHSVIT